MKKNNFFNLNLPDKILGVERSFIFLFVPPLILIIVFMVSLGLVILPKISEIGDVAKKTSDLKANTLKVKEQNRYLASIDQEELKRDAEYLDNAVLKDKKSYLLVGIIRNIANKYNYQLESFSLTPGELKSDKQIEIKSSSEDTVKMPVSLSVVGPKESGLDLILALEKTLPIIFIDKFETKTFGELSQFDLVVSSYYLNDKSNIETKNVNLTDLILSKEETALINRISSFSKIEENQNENGIIQFQQYQRENPFRL